MRGGNVKEWTAADDERLLVVYLYLRANGEYHQDAVALLATRFGRTHRAIKTRLTEIRTPIRREENDHQA